MVGLQQASTVARPGRACGSQQRHRGLRAQSHGFPRNNVEPSSLPGCSATARPRDQRIRGHPAGHREDPNSHCAAALPRRPGSRGAGRITARGRYAMMPLDCAPVRELVPELALGVLSGSEHAEVLLHASQCTRCQALIGELGEAADALPSLAPEIEPPPGFETHRARHAARLTPEEHASVGSRARVDGCGSGHHQHRRRAIGQTPAVDRPRRPHPLLPCARLPWWVTTACTIETGLYTTAGKPTAIVVTVDYWVATGTYRVELQPTGGPAQRLGTIRIDDGRGSWGGAARLAASGSTRVALVDTHGTAVCHATLSRAHVAANRPPDDRLCKSGPYTARSRTNAWSAPLSRRLRARVIPQPPGVRAGTRVPGRAQHRVG